MSQTCDNAILSRKTGWPSDSSRRFARPPLALAACTLLACALSSAQAPAAATVVPIRVHDSQMHDLGVVVFPTSCAPAVQTDFQRGVALMHSFAYEDAVATFVEIERKDSACGMAYWGEAMSYYHQIWDPPDADHLRKGFAAARKALAIPGQTNRERDYIQAISEFYEDWEQSDYRARALRYKSAMEHLYISFPEDREAAVFYALTLISTASSRDPDYADKRKAGAILEKVFAEQPLHPGVAHYLIHAYDNPVLATQGLNAARRYAQIAPASVHALHMPSHIFVQVGSWRETIDSNLASLGAAREYSTKHQLKGLWDMEAHALDYLAYAYLQLGRDQEAMRILDEVKAVHDQRVGESPAASYSAFAGILARYAMERKQWSEACVLEDHNLPQALYQAETYSARAIGCARSGSVQDARSNLNLLAKLQSLIPPSASSDADASFVEIQKREASAWFAFALKDENTAVQLMRSAVALEKSTLAVWFPAPIAPASEQLGELLLELNRPEEALAAFEISMTATPNRFNGLFGAGHAAEMAGDSDKAKTYYKRLVENCKDADSGRTELATAKAFLRQYVAAKP